MWNTNPCPQCCTRNHRHLLLAKETFDCLPPENLTFEVPSTEHVSSENGNATTRTNTEEVIPKITRSCRAIKKPEPFKIMSKKLYKQGTCCSFAISVRRCLYVIVVVMSVLC